MMETKELALRLYVAYVNTGKKKTIEACYKEAKVILDYANVQPIEEIKIAEREMYKH